MPGNLAHDENGRSSRPELSWLKSGLGSMGESFVPRRQRPIHAQAVGAGAVAALRVR
jgi:hypothetical protein